MRTKGYGSSGEQEQVEQEQKPKPMQPFELDGEMTVILKNGVRVEISSKDPKHMIVVRRGIDEVVIKEEFNRLKVNTQFFNRD